MADMPTPARSGPFDFFSPGEYVDPNDPGVLQRLKGAAESILSDPFAVSALSGIGAGLAANPWGATPAWSLANAVGTAGEAVRNQSEQQRKEAESSAKVDLSQARAERTLAQIGEAQGKLALGQAESERKKAADEARTDYRNKREQRERDRLDETIRYNTAKIEDLKQQRSLTNDANEIKRLDLAIKQARADSDIQTNKARASWLEAQTENLPEVSRVRALRARQDAQHSIQADYSADMGKRLLANQNILDPQNKQPILSIRDWILQNPLAMQRANDIGLDIGTIPQPPGVLPPATTPTGTPTPPTRAGATPAPAPAATPAPAILSPAQTLAVQQAQQAVDSGISYEAVIGALVKDHGVVNARNMIRPRASTSTETP